MNENEIKEMIHKYKLRKENYDHYKPNKKYYYENSDELYAKAQLKEQQEYLESFINYKDLPRATVNILGSRRAKEFASGYFVASLPVAYVLGRYFANEKYGIYSTPHRINNLRKLSYIGLIIFGLIYIPTIPVFTPQNSGIFKPQFYEKKVQRDLDLKLNLYRNVETIINQDEEPSWEDYHKVMQSVRNKTLQTVILPK